LKLHDEVSVNAIDFFDHGWRLNPAAPCLIDASTGTVLSYDDVRGITVAVAANLRALGYEEGCKASVLSPNHPVAYAVVLGIVRAGLTWIPMNPRLGETEIAAMYHDFDCEVLFYLSPLAAAVGVIRRSPHHIKEFICIDAAGEDPILAAWMKDAPAGFAELPHDPERAYVIQPTGGTTGRPKGVMMVARNLECVVAGLMIAMPGARRPVFLAAAPLTHAGGMVMQSILAQGGAGVVVGKISASVLLEAIPKYRVTHVFLPPTVIYDLLASPEVGWHDYSSLVYFMYAASPIAPAKLREAIEVFGPVMTQLYGQTEAGLPNTFLGPAEHLDAAGNIDETRLTSCGRASPLSRVAIMAPDGTLLPRGEIGEIVIQSHGVMIGYYKNPDATAEVSAHGWHHTGDLAYQDAEGFFHIVDRIKDMVISGGFNIYSAEVEAGILAHPAVKDCAVIGVPDAKWGEALKAFVELKPGETVTEPELLGFCRDKLGGMKTPKTLHIIDAIPRSATGKILKRDLRAAYWEGSGRMVS
jgi:acyl-CoA synthetase (AMP-forming)/AMP-acid ligase II